MPKWFGPKTFGYGISPRTWQGWLATAIMLGAIVLAQHFFEPAAFGLPQWWRAIAMIGVIAVYLLIAYTTYDPDL